MDVETLRYRSAIGVLVAAAILSAPAPAEAIRDPGLIYAGQKLRIP